MQRDALLLAEMIGAVDRIVELVGVRSADEILADDLRRDALLWNFTVVGEAASQVSDQLKASHSDLPWSDPVRLRNRIVHGYWSVDMDVLVTTASEDLPALVERLRVVEASLRES